MNNERGSTLTMVMALFLIVSIVIMGALSFAQLYHSRSVRLYDQSQAYITARSAADVVANDIFLEKQVLRDLKSNKTLTIQMDTLPNAMGKATVVVTLDDTGKFIDIKSTGYKGKEQKTITLKMEALYSGGATGGITLPEFDAAKQIEIDQYKTSPYVLDSYMCIIKENNGLKNETIFLESQNNSNIYIFVEEGASVSIKDIVLTYQDVDVYLILGAGSSFKILSNYERTLPIYVYGPQATFEASHHITIHGYVETGVEIGDFKELDIPSKDPGMSLGGIKWQKVGYYNESK